MAIARSKLNRKTDWKKSEAATQLCRKATQVRYPTTAEYHPLDSLCHIELIPGARLVAEHDATTATPPRATEYTSTWSLHTPAINPSVSAASADGGCCNGNDADTAGAGPLNVTSDTPDGPAAERYETTAVANSAMHGTANASGVAVLWIGTDTDTVIVEAGRD